MKSRALLGCSAPAPPSGGNTIGSGGDFATLEDWWAQMQADSPISDARTYTLLNGNHTLSGTGASSSIPHGLRMDGVVITGSIKLVGEGNHGGSFSGSGARIIQSGTSTGSTVLSPWSDNLTFEDLVLEFPGAVDGRSIRGNTNYSNIVFNRCLMMGTSGGGATKSVIHIPDNAGLGGTIVLNACAGYQVNQFARSVGSPGELFANFCTVLPYATGNAVGFIDCKGCILFNFSAFNGGGDTDCATDWSDGAFPNRTPADELVNITLNSPATVDLRLKSGTTTLQDVISTGHGGVNFDFLNAAKPQGVDYDCGCHELG